MTTPRKTPEQEPIRLTRLEVRGFKRITAASFALRPGLNEITSGGENGQGKSSLVEALTQLFLGAGAEPDNPINDASTDEKRAQVQAWLSNGWTIETVRTEKGRYLHVKGPNGEPGNQTTLNQWTGRAAMQLGRFWELRPEEQTERLLSLSPQADLLERLEANADRYNELYAERTPHISEQMRLRKVKAPAGERPEPVEVAAEMARLKELRAQDAERENVRARHNETRRALKELSAQGEALDEEIAELERALAKKREARGTLTARLEKGAEVVAGLRETFNSMEDPAEEIAAVEAHLSEADAVRRAAEPWDEYERAQKGLAAATEEAERLTAEIKAVQAERQEILAGADLPVEGLSVDEEGALLLNGRPLSAASGAERTQLEIQAAIAENPRLRLVVCDEADGIGKKKRQEIAEIADRHGLDVILVRIGGDEAGDLEIIDGVGSNLPDEEERAHDPGKKDGPMSGPKPSGEEREEIARAVEAELDEGAEPEAPVTATNARSFLLDEDDEDEADDGLPF